MSARTPQRPRCGVLWFCLLSALVACTARDYVSDTSTTRRGATEEGAPTSGEGAPANRRTPTSTVDPAAEPPEASQPSAYGVPPQGALPSEGSGNRDPALPTADVPSPYHLETALEWRAGLIETTVPQRLLDGPDLVLWRQAWRSGSHTGWAWWVEAPRTTAQRVLAVDGLRSFDDIFEPQISDWAAINGGFYDGSLLDGFAPMGLVVADGVERSPFVFGGGSGIYYVRDGEAAIAHRSEWPIADVSQALQSIDRIVDAGVSLVTIRQGARRAARSAVLVTDDTVAIVIAVANDSLGQLGADGQQLERTSYLGLTLGEFAGYLVAEHKAVAALNLDGAVSSQFVASIAGVHFRLLGERGTVNAIQLGASPL